MRERRRLALASRQLMLAQIARRAAMGALADAVEEEARSAAVSERSRALLSAYGARSAGSDAAALRNHSAFLHALQGIAGQAEKARQDASDQARWQLQTLAAAETRADRLEERRELAQRALRAVLDRREQPLPKGMARKLQSSGRDAEPSRPAQQPRSRK